VGPGLQNFKGVSVRLVTDPRGRNETRALSRLCVAIHVGRSVYMSCERAGQKHRGLLVHGDIDIIPAHTPSVWEPDEKDTALALGVDSALLAQAAEDSGVDPDRVEILNRFQIRDPQIENIGWAFKAEMEAGYPSGRVYMESLGTALAACLVLRHSTVAPLPAASSGAFVGHRLKRVLAYIEENLGQNVSLSQIAEVAGVRISHFKVIFRQAMGVPVHQYIIQRRVEQARTLLTDTDLPISQVATSAGFTHQSHMAAHMRRILGNSPKAVRNQRR
jgi:AraC family transcriptional regulator